MKSKISIITLGVSHFKKSFEFYSRGLGFKPHDYNQKDGGGYSGYFADPDGYLWEVAYNPFTNLT